MKSVCRISVACMGLFFSAVQWAEGQVITTAVGTDYSVDIDGKNATEVPLGGVVSVAVDAAGNLFVASASSRSIYRVAPDGTTTTVAGNGFLGVFFGVTDGLPARSTALVVPMALATDAEGNLYFTNVGSVRRVSRDGVITTALRCSNCPGVSESAPSDPAIQVVTDVAFDGRGNMYSADYLANLVWRLRPGGALDIAAGGGKDPIPATGKLGTQVALRGPSSVVATKTGDIYIFENTFGAVWKLAGGVLTHVAGNGAAAASGDGGLATAAGLGRNKYYPTGSMALGLSEELFLLEAGQARVRRVGPDGVITTVAGNGMRGFSGDGGPARMASIAVDSAEREFGDVAADSAGNLFIADTNNSRVRKVDTGGTITTVAGNGLVRFRRDGVVAQEAFLNQPSRLAWTPSGELLILDFGNHVVRKVDKKNIISTVAGNGMRGVSGDGGPATKASLATPLAIAADHRGNLYISDEVGHRIRRVSPDGIIQTFFRNVGFPGTGVMTGVPGDTLSWVVDLAVDDVDNLYIADLGNCRVLKAFPDGRFTHVAGNGTNVESGREGPATRVGVCPVGIAFDPQGNLVVADGTGQSIRRIDNRGVITTLSGPRLEYGLISALHVDRRGRIYTTNSQCTILRIDEDGVLRTIAGRGLPSDPAQGIFSGDGLPATEAFLNLYGKWSGLTTDVLGNIYISDAGNDRVRKILAQPPAISPLPAIRLSANSDGAPVTARLRLAATEPGTRITIPGVRYTVQVESAARETWLSATPAAGVLPGLVEVTADPTGLKPGTYTGTVKLFTPDAVPAMSSSSVQVAVGPALPPQLAIDPDQQSSTFPYSVGGQARSRDITIYNAGGGTLRFNAVLESEAAWVRLEGATGEATPKRPATLRITAVPDGLAPGVYSARVRVTPSVGQPATLRITMTISSNPKALLLSQTGLTFTAVENGGVVPPQSFGVINIGHVAADWRVEARTLSGGDWLRFTPGRGLTAAGGGARVPLVSVSVAPSGLATGVYYGQLRVLCDGAANSPQVITVVLDVRPQGSDVPPLVNPKKVTLTTAEKVAPASVDFAVYDPTGTAKSYRTAMDSSMGAVALLRGSATIDPKTPGRIIAQPYARDRAGRRTYKLAVHFSDGQLQEVEIEHVVRPEARARGDARSNARPADADATCPAAKSLTPTLMTLDSSFEVTAGWPVALQVQVSDDCGRTLDSGSVSVEFSSKDRPLALRPLGLGRWDGTWRTALGEARSVDLWIHARSADGQLTGDVKVSGDLQANRDRPDVPSGGVVVSDIGDPDAPLAPGSLIVINGTHLTEGTQDSTKLPLEQCLAGSIVTMADQQLPLVSAANEKIKAIVPFDMAINTRQQVVVRRGLTYSDPVYVNIAATQPSILLDKLLTPQILAADGNLSGSNNPLQPGQKFSVLCTGLGAITPDHPAGWEAPDAAVIAPVKVIVGLVDITPSKVAPFPNLPGWYRVDATMPSNVPTGEGVPLRVQAGDQISPAQQVTVR